MNEKFGSIIISLGFEVDLDDLADVLGYEDESREKLIERAKEDFMDTIIFEGGKLYDYIEIEEVK